MKFICIQFNLTELYPNFPLRAKIDSYLDFHHLEIRKLSLLTMDFFVGPKFFNKEMPKNYDERVRELNELLHFIVNVFFGGGKYTQKQELYCTNISWDPEHPQQQIYHLLAKFQPCSLWILISANFQL